jgi:hypothetical protein
MGLLVLSYIGSLLVGTGKTRGLPSGIEFIGLGFAVGPQALGLVDRPMITEFEPIAPGRRVKKSSTVLGIACAVVTGVAVAAAAYYMTGVVHIPGIDGINALILAAGAGAVCAETARNAAEWVQARWGAKGPVSRLLVDIGAADDLAPLVAAGAIFAIAPSPGVAVSLPAWGWFLASVALGVLLGIVTAMLLRGAEGDAVWGALIGTLLLGVGTAARFGFCTIFVTFAMGIALAGASPSRRVLRKMVIPTERAVLYPMLLLAGARLDPMPVIENRMMLALVALVLLARIVGKVISGFLVRATAAAARPAGVWLGIVLLSSGPVSTACGFVFALRFPGPVGDTILLCAVASAVLGELVSTLSLKAMLTETGEIVVQEPAPPPSPSVRAPSIPPMPIAPSSANMLAAEEEERPAQ